MRVIWAFCFVFCMIALQSVVFGDYYDDYEGVPSDPYGGGAGNDPSGPPEARELKTNEDIDSFLKENEYAPVILGYFDEEANSEDFNAFQELVASDGHYLTFGYTLNKQLLESKKLDGCGVFVYPPSKFINEKYERSKYRYPGKHIKSISSLFDFVIKKSIPLVGILNANSGAVYSKQTNPIVTIFTSIDLEKNWKGFQYIANRVRKVAKEFTNKLVFNVANLGDFAYEMSTMYDIITPNPKSTYVGLKEDKTYYHMIESFSVDHLQSFVQQFLAHELQGKVYEGSEASSEDDKDSSVVTLTNENFQSIVEDSSQDILVEFYAPWCGHCQALKPEYRKVADYFNNDKGVTIAAMDATAHNAPPKYDVQGYPTLFFLPGNNKRTPIPYNGPRDAKEMIQFITKKRTTIASNEEL